MGMRWMLGLFGASVCSCLLICPSVRAADEETAEAAPVSPTDATREHILQEIETVRQTDPELAATMEEQLELYEAGELDLRAPELGAGESTGTQTLAMGEGSLQGGGLPGGPQFVGPPVEGDAGTMPSYMTPELREQLFNVYDQAAAGGLSEQEARTQAEAILQEHGIDPQEVGPGHEREFNQEALEHMSPEAREQFEQYREQMDQSREQGEQYREQMEHNYYGAPEHEFETMTHESEATAHEYESPTQEYEATTHEYEAPAHEYEATAHEYETPAHEYEAPTHEYETPEPMEAPDQPEVDAPEGQQYEAPEGEHEYQPPQP